jgi:DNA-binding NarL/FixJ family response regulator
MALTERQKRMLTLVAQGSTDEQIASDALVSLSVAKREMHNIRTKLGAHSRAHAVAIGFVKGYLQASGEVPHVR